ncbi:MAG: Xaa-Pro peptidase family protein [Acidobacteriota bacterium]
MGHPEFSPFPVSEYEARVTKARRLMEESGIDALVLTSKENVVYFAGIQTIGWDSKHRPLIVIVPRDPSSAVHMVLAESLYYVARESSWVDELRPWGGWMEGASEDPIAGAFRVLQDLGLASGTLGLELGYGQRMGMSQEDYCKLVEGLPEAKLVDGSELIWELRMIKSPLEIEALRKACAATTSAFEKGFSALRPGMREKELAGIMFAEMARHTDERPGFMMVRSGPRKYRMANVLAFDKPMTPGELVVVDSGAVYKDYWADFMRMSSIGEPTKEQRRFFDATLESQQAGVDKLAPGVTAHDIFSACNDVLVAHGLADYVTFERLGHGVGLDMHEPPSMARGSELVIQPGMVLTVEPVFWDRPDGKVGNFALEDVVVVTEEGHEVLSLFPKDLHIVPV